MVGNGFETDPALIRKTAVKYRPNQNVLANYPISSFDEHQKLRNVSSQFALLLEGLHQYQICFEF